MVELKRDIVISDTPQGFAAELFNWAKAKVKPIMELNKTVTTLRDSATEFEMAINKNNVYVGSLYNPYDSTTGFCMTFGGTQFNATMRWDSTPGAYKYVIDYYLTKNMFCIKSITQGDAGTAPNKNYSLGTGSMFAVNDDVPLCGIITATSAAAPKITSVEYGDIGDSWKVVPRYGLANKVLVWKAQYSILNHELIYRFSTSAQGFPTAKHSIFTIENLGDFMIIEATGTTDVTGLAVKL